MADELIVAIKGPRLVSDVEVVALEGQDDAEIAAFMHNKRRWVYDKREELSERTVDNPFPTRFATGGKVLYRGRRLRRIIQVGEANDAQVHYRNGFEVATGEWLTEQERDAAVRRALTRWMKARVCSDARAFVRRHAPSRALSLPDCGAKTSATYGGAAAPTA